MDVNKDDRWLVKLAIEQYPERTDVIKALESCSIDPDTRQAYICFVDASLPNKPGSKWQFKENIILEHPAQGTIVLDVLKSGEIGGVEIIQNIGN